MSAPWGEQAENRDGREATTDTQGGREAWLGDEVGDPSL